MQRASVSRVMGTCACLLVLFLSYRLDYNRGTQDTTRDDLAAKGPAVGTPFPPFELLEVGGDLLSLKSLMGKPSVIIFARSLDWCPFTKTMVTQLAAALGTHPKANVVLVFAANQVDSKAVRFLFDRRIAFRVAIDRTRQLIDGLGLTNTTLRNRIETGVPYLATFVLDRDGIVRLRDTRRDHSVWLAGEYIRKVLDSLD